MTTLPPDLISETEALFGLGGNRSSFERLLADSGIQLVTIAGARVMRRADFHALVEKRFRAGIDRLERCA